LALGVSLTLNEGCVPAALELGRYTAPSQCFLGDNRQRRLGLIEWRQLEGAASAGPYFKVVPGFVGWCGLAVVRGSVAV